jgi:hypothetical protein
VRSHLDVDDAIDAETVAISLTRGAQAGTCGGGARVEWRGGRGGRGGRREMREMRERRERRESSGGAPFSLILVFTTFVSSLLGYQLVLLLIIFKKIIFCKFSDSPSLQFPVNYW